MVNVSSVRALVSTPYISMGPIITFSPWLGACSATRQVLSPIYQILANDRLHIGIYSASKAALTIASETLRLELAPFHITIMIVMLGVVQLGLLANTAEVDLPPGSMYAPVERQIHKVRAGSNMPKAINADKFAEKLVKDILRGKKGRV